MRPAARRAGAVGRAVALLLSLAAVGGGLTACSPDAPPVQNRAVLTVAAARVRYLDATCPLRAETRFWQPIAWSGRQQAAAVADAVLPVADRALQRLTGGTLPYPAQLAAPVQDLARTIQRNRAYFQAARTATGAAALQRAAQPAAVPQADTGAIEQIVFVTSQPGSSNCPGHGMPSATPTPSATD